MMDGPASVEQNRPRLQTEPRPQGVKSTFLYRFFSKLSSAAMIFRREEIPIGAVRNFPGAVLHRDRQVAAVARVVLIEPREVHRVRPLRAARRVARIAVVERKRLG